MIIIITIVIITIIINSNNKMSKQRYDSHNNQYRALCELSVPKHANITKNSTLDTAWVLHAPLKRLIHHLK